MCNVGSDPDGTRLISLLDFKCFAGKQHLFWVFVLFLFVSFCCLSVCLFVCLFVFGFGFLESMYVWEHERPSWLWHMRSISDVY